ncbi:MAG: hypothetical protein IIA60_00525 [Candidatus Marinimicrobia bacterium]|nr:hypothetical protein [Candidatus Neomarinimicrobiota bacterium]
MTKSLKKLGFPLIFLQVIFMLHAHSGTVFQPENIQITEFLTTAINGTDIESAFITDQVAMPTASLHL